jgi:FkbM family methyltransferase
MASIRSTLQFIARHPLSSRRPLSAYWRYARWQVESRLCNEVVFEWIDRSRLVARNGMTGATGNIYCGLHEFADMAFLLHFLGPEDLFVDVGANIGSYTVLASAVCGARSISIEPDPDTMSSLRRNVEANGIGSRVRLVETAVGSQAGVIRFTVGHDTTNRVATDADGRTREVIAQTLDEILQGWNPVLIKMDVEGYEPKVVAGAAETLKNPSLLAVLTETADEPVCSALNTAGFQTASYDAFARVLTAGRGHKSANVLFVRDLDACRSRVRGAPRRIVLGTEL